MLWPASLRKCWTVLTGSLPDRGARPSVLTARCFYWGMAIGVLLINGLVFYFTLSNLQQSRRQAFERVSITTDNLAHLLEQNIVATSNMVDLALREIIDELEVELRHGRFEEAAINRHLVAGASRLPMVEAIRVTDAEGRLRWGKGVHPAVAQSYADREFFQEHRRNAQSGLLVTRPVFGKVSQQWTIAFTRSYHYPDGRFAGVISAALPVTSFAGQLSQLQLGRRGAAVLRADDLGLIARYPEVAGPRGEVGNKVVSPEFQALLFSGKASGSFHTRLSPDGVERIYAFRRLAGMPIAVSVGLSVDEYLDSWQHDWTKTGWLLFAFLLLTSGAAALLSFFWQRRLTDAASLLASEARFRSYVQDSPFAVFVVDGSGRCIDCNPAASDLLGGDRASLLQLSIADLLPPTLLAEGAEELAELRREGRIEREYPLRRRDGSEIWVQLRAVRQSADRWLGFCQDITRRKRTEEALSKQEGLLRQIFDTSSVAIFLVDNEGIITVANQRMADMFGCPLDKIVGSEYVNLVHPGERETGRARMLALLASNVDDVDLERHYWHHDGKAFWGRLTGRRFYDERGERRGLIGVIDDISQRKAAELALKESEAYNRLLFSESRTPMVVIDPDSGQFVDCNAAAVHIYGFERGEQVLGLTPLAVSAPTQYDGGDSAEAAKQRIDECMRVGSLSFPWRHQRPSGEMWDADVFLMRFDHGDRTLLQFQLHDITEKKVAAELVWRKANFDTLTSLPNRQLFYDRLQLLLKQAERADSKVALLFIDLDHFKEVNDTLGHDKGDILLKHAAERLLGCLRESDTVARLGGDEFTVILGEIEQQADVERVTRNILERLAEPYLLGNETVYVSASVGITLYPDDGLGAEDLLKNADQAMYAAKDAGRNAFSWFTSDMQQGAQQRRLLAQDLRTALLVGQFEVYYQPIVDLVSRRIVKAEALLRWHHPERGMVPPSLFIPIAEEMGLINEIGDWVFRQAAQMLHRWRHLPVSADVGGMQISVNKSPRQFLTGKTDVSWIDYLRELGLEADSIVIEITEGLLLDDRPEIADKLLNFHRQGVQIALDDFGTGYSAMSYLQKFDIDYLKIDQSFVRNLVASPGDLAIAEAIIAMAHKLGMKAIAEGIETVQQCDLLAAAGCDFGQGYLFSRPVPAAAFEALLENGLEAIAA